MKIVLITGGIVLGCVMVLFALIDVAIVRVGECVYAWHGGTGMGR